MKSIDPDGREANPVYTKSGDFLGNTKEGFTGHPLIMNKNDYEMMVDIFGANYIFELSAEAVKSCGGKTFDELEEQVLNGIAQEKIVSHIISHYEDSDLSKNHNFSASDVASRIKYDTEGKRVGNTNFATFTNGRRPAIFFFKHNNKAYEFTVENIISSIVYHEWFGHEKMGWGNDNQKAKVSAHGTHYACYLSVMTSPIYKKTTAAYQNFNKEMFNLFFK